MMMKFERLEGPCGIPVFYQQMPEFVKSSSLALVMFTGSADDTSVAEPGIYHWFEHVPFQGTTKFPGGYRAIQEPVTKVGGRIGASTNSFRTSYWASLPTRHIGLGLEAVVDLVAQPLLTDQAILAEREIIKQEIHRSLGNANRLLSLHLDPFLWGDHPHSHPVLGTAESLDSMTPELLRKARTMGYSRSRAAFFVSTALSSAEILDMVSTDCFQNLPANDISERRSWASFGPLSWKAKGKLEVETKFESTLVKILFWLPAITNKVDVERQSLLHRLIAYGGLSSPLYHAVREKNQLAYATNLAMSNSPDGGYWGFQVETSSKNVGRVEEALKEMLQDPRIRSKERFEEIREAARCGLEMRTISPSESVDIAVRQTSITGSPVTEEESIEISDSIPHEEILGMIDRIDFEQAQVAVALGK